MSYSLSKFVIKVPWDRHLRLNRHLAFVNYDSCKDSSIYLYSYYLYLSLLNPWQIGFVPKMVR